MSSKDGHAFEQRDSFALLSRAVDGSLLTAKEMSVVLSRAARSGHKTIIAVKGLR